MTKDDIPGNSGEIDQVASLRVLENMTILGNATITGGVSAATVNSSLWQYTRAIQVGTESKTITAAGIALSNAIIVSFITTDGSAGLNIATLVNGSNIGQMKICVCVALGNAGDTWKIVPAAMIGGTIITFPAVVGLGCILIYTAGGWVLVGNNGGVVS